MKSKTAFRKEEVIKTLGGHQKAAKYLGISSQAISQWPPDKDIPRIHQLTLIINMPREFPAI